MSNQVTRRETLQKGLTAAGLLALADSVMPALAQGEADAVFTDYPANYNPANPTAPTRQLDIRTIDGQFTPNDKFFFIQHYNKPEIDPNAYRLKLTGMVNKPVGLSLADLKSMKPTDLINGYECSGNSARSMQGLSSNG